MVHRIEKAEPGWKRDREEYLALCRHLEEVHGVRVIDNRGYAEKAHEAAHRRQGTRAEESGDLATM